MKNETPSLFPDPEPEPRWKTREDFPLTSDDGAARRTDPETSKKAAREVNTGTLKAAVILCLYRHGPRTAEEIVEITGKAIDSITPRTAPLKRDGYIKTTGETRPGKSGADRDIWQLTDKGRELALRLIALGD